MSKAVAKSVEATEVAPIAQQESAALISMIERASRDPSVDMDKFERLIAVTERIEARRAEAAFNAAMSEVQAKLKPVARKLQNSQTNSKYADLAAISEAADPIIHEGGFGFITSEFQSSLPNHLGVRAKVTHAAGHSETHDFNVPVDGTGLKGNPNKTATHAYASTLTYGRRYAKCCVFDIATKNDMDGNSAKADDGFITPEQAEELSKLITETNSDIHKFLAMGGIESLSDLPARQFVAAKALLLKKKGGK